MKPSAREKLAQPIRAATPAEGREAKPLREATEEQLEQLLGDEIRYSLVDGSLERTMDGASTLELTFDDPDRVILSAHKTLRGMKLALSGYSFRVVAFRKQGDSLMVTCEDEVVNRLRKYRKPRKMRRGLVNRAQFVNILLREATPRVPSYIPEYYTSGQGGAARPESLRGEEKRAPGIPPGAKIRVKGADLGPKQIRNANTVIRVAKQLRASNLATIALLEACIVEPSLPPWRPFDNPPGGDASSVGILQLLAMHGSFSERMNIERSVRIFLTKGFTGQGGAIALAQRNPNRSPGWIAQAVQGSDYPGRYDEHFQEAKTVLEAFNGGGELEEFELRDQKVKVEKYEFSRGRPGGVKGENTWEAITRLAEDVNWRCFIRDGAVWFVSDDELIRAQPAEIISEETTWVNNIDFELDDGQKTKRLTVSVIAERGFAPPGSVIEVQDCGPANGRWLVHSVSQNLFDDETEIELRQRERALAEPKGEEVDESPPVGGVGTGDKDFTGRFLRPTGVWILTSPFRPPHRPSHEGIDIGMPIGTSVRASAAGVVSFTGFDPGGYGNWIEIKHDGVHRTRYGHLSRIMVRNGQRVAQGQEIAKSGNTGGSTGPHLHFEIRKNGAAVNPLPLLP